MAVSCRFIKDVECDRLVADHLLEEITYPNIEVCTACLLAKIYRKL